MPYNNSFSKSKIIFFASVLCTTVLSSCATTDNSNRQVETQESADCGRVSVFFSPSKTKKFYPASIFNIDGNNVHVSKQVFKLKPGIHKISMFNASSESLAQLLMDSHKGVGGKGIEFEVKANTTYHLAAKHNPERNFKTRKQGHWDPVVWKVSENSCLL